jgi:competence protein ComEA
MDAPSPLLGVAAESPPSARPTPAPLAPPRAAGAVASAWPRPAQWATAALLLLALGLLAWHAAGAQRWASRPTALEPDAARDRIDLNRADHAELLQLPGVGETTARRIEDYRAAHHGFRDVDELRQVRGVGPALMERLRPLVEVEPFEGDEDFDPTPPDDLPGPAPAARRDRPSDAAKGQAPAARKANALARAVNINRASAEELQRLPGVGPTLAARIIHSRELRPFKSADDLRHVGGIGAKKLELMRPFVTVDD